MGTFNGGSLIVLLKSAQTEETEQDGIAIYLQPQKYLRHIKNGNEDITIW